MNNKTVACKICNEKIEKNSKVCPHCGTKNPYSFYKSNLFYSLIGILGALILLFVIAPAIYKGNEITNAMAFSNEGHCGVSASAKLSYSPYNDKDTIHLSIDAKNTSPGKNISTINFYVIYYDKNGNNINDSERFHTEEPLKAYENSSYLSFIFNSNVKDVDLYIYNVKFDDGSEWGNEKAMESTILKKGIKVNVNNNLD